MYRVLLDTLANGCKRIYIIRKRYSLYFFGGGSEWMFIHRLVRAVPSYRLFALQELQKHFAVAALQTSQS